VNRKSVALPIALPRNPDCNTIVTNSIRAELEWHINSSLHVFPVYSFIISRCRQSAVATPNRLIERSIAA